MTSTTPTHHIGDDDNHGSDASIIADLSEVTHRLWQADECRRVAQQDAQKSCPGLERQSKGLGRQIYANKQVLRTKQRRFNDVSEMGFCAEKCLWIWSKNYSSKAEAVSIVQQELVAEEARLKETCATKNEIDRRIQSLQAAVAATEQYFQSLFDQKRRLLMKSCPSTEATLNAIIDRKSELRIDIEQTQKTLAAGELALSSLRDASKYLDSARAWGQADIMGGGATISAVKRSRMNAAKALVAQASRHMQVLQHECIEVNSLMSKGAVFDVWCDNIFTDIAVQNRIAQAAQHCDAAIAKISPIVSSFRQKLATDQRELDECEQNFIDTVLSYEIQRAYIKPHSVEAAMKSSFSI